jgi:hypothetical protein
LLSHTLGDEESADFLLTSIAERPSSKLQAWQLITHSPSRPTYRRLKSAVSNSEKNLYGSFRPTAHVALERKRTREIANIIEAEVIIFSVLRLSFLLAKIFVTFLPSSKALAGMAVYSRVSRGKPTRAISRSATSVPKTASFTALTPSRDSVYGVSLSWRLHGTNGYRYTYTDDDLTEICEKLYAHAEPAYVMLNNISLKEDALRFLQQSGPST